MTSMAEVGLRIILTQIISKTNRSGNILVTSTLISAQTGRSLLPPPSTSNTTRCRTGNADCFLKSCHLCREKLSPRKDIYMCAGGDRGFLRRGMQGQTDRDRREERNGDGGENFVRVFYRLGKSCCHARGSCLIK
ncbi:FLZ-type domain-containing protein [Psidium guajava]|nr:FLZ-type domain-containing protein [Psidium guajava]